MNSWYDRMKIWLHGEREKLRGKTGRQKVSYIITYYWLWILGIFCAVAIPGYMIRQAVFSVKDFWFYAVYANTMGDGGNGSPLWEDFVSYAGFDLTQKKTEMNDSFWFDPSVSGGTNNSYFQAFAALVEAGDLDVVVLGKKGLQGIGSSGRLLDLRNERCVSIYTEYADRLVFCEPYDTEYSEEPGPVGIDVSDSLLVTKYKLYEGDAVLGIGAYTKRLESVEKFLDFILNGDRQWENG